MILDSVRKTLNQQELLQLLKNCDLAGTSRSSSAMSSRTPSPSPSLMSIMCPGYKPVTTVSHTGTPISTPLMNHTSGSEAHLNVPSPTDFIMPNRLTRASGVFSGSMMSLSGGDPEISDTNEINEVYTTPTHHFNETTTDNSQIEETDVPIEMSIPFSSVVLSHHSPPVSPPPSVTQRPGSSIDNRSQEMDVLVFRRVQSDTKTSKSHFVSPPHTSETLSTLRPVSLDSSSSAIGSQSVSSMDSDVTLTPGTSRPSSSSSPDRVPSVCTISDDLSS